jgi:hypothetical protein
MAKTISEDDLFANRRGKWSQSGVPHKGWLCIEIEDLGSPDLTCEMCESREIRYVHHMQHDSYQSAVPSSLPGGVSRTQGHPLDAGVSEHHARAAAGSR